mmetsp:Transcript_18261/g.51148  ORF Transcript_18261/g.51148 Transcript_18261/m.51148 type:complete len:458 (+) Transcript_18261:261-1634(+)
MDPCLLAQSLGPTALLLQGGIHLIHMLLVVLEQLRALELEGGGHQIPLHVKRLGVEVHSLHKLKALQLVCPANSIEPIHNHLLHLVIAAEGFEVALDLVLLCPRHQLRLQRHGDSHQHAFIAVSIHPDLLQHLKLLQCALHLLHRNVLTLGELENILFPVNDLQVSGLDDLTNVSSVEPAISILCLLGEVITLVVTIKHGGALDANLSPGRVGQGIVVHVRDGLEADADAGQRGAHIATHAAGQANRGAGHGLGQAVALDNIAHHGNLEELFDVHAQRRCARHNQLHAATQGLLDLREHELVEERRRLLLSVAALHELLLPVVGPVEELALNPAGGLHLGHHTGVDAVKDAGHAAEQGGLEGGDILDHQLHIAAVVANGATALKEKLLDGPVKDMGKWQVGQEGVSGANSVVANFVHVCLGSRNLGQDVAVLHHDALGVAGGATGVHDCAEIIRRAG